MFNLESKCANPRCPTQFDWHMHGKFYRFYRDVAPGNGYSSAPRSNARRRDVEHFWLCEDCAGVFTLAFEPEHGITLCPRGFVRRAAEHEELTAA